MVNSPASARLKPNPKSQGSSSVTREFLRSSSGDPVMESVETIATKPGALDSVCGDTFCFLG